LRRRHFEALRPICPSCLVELQREAPLEIGFAVREQAGLLLEGALRCTAPDCRLEYPIVDGIPVLVPDPRAYLAANLPHVLQRGDLSAEIENMLGECAGPGSLLDATRQNLGSYVWDHYADLDPAEEATGAPPGSLRRALDRALELIGGPLGAPVLEAGCSVGRGTFELALRSSGLALGIDTHLPMLRLAAAVLRDGEVRYDRRHGGMLYARRRFAARFDSAERVDFWAADATAPPFPAATFGAVVALNVLDCVAAPLSLLRSAERVLAPGGSLLLASPYDWSGAVTAPESWIGGHSPRSSGQGRSESVLRALLTRGAHPAAVERLELRGEADDVPWRVRLHERHAAEYRLHVVHAVVRDPSSP
jgi:SAM-dependent methyltransferase/uncharacterized protein YbaR (Trm112 family)